MTTETAQATTLTIDQAKLQQLLTRAHANDSTCVPELRALLESRNAMDLRSGGYASSPQEMYHAIQAPASRPREPCRAATFPS